MRLTWKNRLRLLPAALALLLGFNCAVAPATAQKIVGQPPDRPLKDTSTIKPPPGAKVAIIEFEDMECPSCAHAFPIVHQAVDHYKIPLIRHDFPLGAMHPWSFEAAVDARYIQDKISPKTAEEYRGAVFTAQAGIGNKDDLATFTRRFYQSHSLQMPFVMDPSGQFAKEVREDHDLGDKVGVSGTPAIFVCTDRNWVLVSDQTQLFQVIDTMESQVSSTPAPPVKKASR
jgi:protein-disulfide isomerase